jgi:hypothetical protein
MLLLAEVFDLVTKLLSLERFFRDLAGLLAGGTFKVGGLGIKGR